MNELLDSVAAAPVRAEELEREGLRWYEAVSMYPPIDSQALAEIYAGELLDAKSRLHIIEAERVKITGPLNAALTAANNFFKKARAPYEQTELFLKGAIGTWQIAQRRAQEQAQREAEAAAQTERERLRAEATAKERQAQEAALNAPEAAGVLVQEALDLRQAALSTAAAVIAAPAKIAGVQLRGQWVGEVYDDRALREFVGTHPEFDHLLKNDQSAINALCRSLKDRTNVPGIRVEFVPIVAAGRK